MTFPILYLPSTNADIWPMTDDRRLQRCFEEDIAGYTNATIVDSDGTKYSIQKAVRQGWGTLLWGYHPMYRAKLVRVNLVLEKKESISLPDTKALLVSHINRGKGKWTSRIYGSRQRLRKLIEEASSWDDLFNVLLYDTE